MMTRERIVGIVLVVLLVVGGAVAALAGPGTAAAPSGAPQAVPPSGAGPGDVTLSADAGRHPGAAAVLAQVQRYYDAINAGNYAAWEATVVPSRVGEQPEQAWRVAYRSTRDGTVRIERIDDQGPGGLLVRVRFVSTQAVADAPPDTPAGRICWRSTLPMEGAPPRIGPTRGGSSVKEAC